MNIVCTGISKSGKLDYFEEVQKYSENLYSQGKGNGKDVRILSVGDIMTQCLEKHTTVNEHILNKDDEELAQAAETAIKTIKIRLQDEKLRGEKEKHNIISTHTCFIWKHHWKESHNEEFLNMLDPDLFITVLDHEKRIQERQHRDHQWALQDLSLEAIALWQDKEARETEKWAKRLGKRHLVLGRNQSPETLYKILNYPDAPVFYSNFPMTYLKNVEESYAKITANNNEMQKYGPVIDPRTIEIMKPEEGSDYSYTLIEKEMMTMLEKKRQRQMRAIIAKVEPKLEKYLQSKGESQYTRLEKGLRFILECKNQRKEEIPSERIIANVEAYIKGEEYTPFKEELKSILEKGVNLTRPERKVEEHLQSRRELEKRIIKCLTVHRDLDYYVSKADIDVLYLPELVLTFGGVAEVIKAYRCSKETYIILPEELKGKNVGPFEVYHSLKIFFGTKEYHDFLSKRFKVLDMYK